MLISAKLIIIFPANQNFLLILKFPSHTWKSNIQLNERLEKVKEK